MGNEYSLIHSQTLRILRFLARIFDEFFSGFRAKFQKIVTCVAFSIKFAKTNQKFAENLNFVKKIHYYSELFTSLLNHQDRFSRQVGKSPKADPPKADPPKADLLPVPSESIATIAFFPGRLAGLQFFLYLAGKALDSFR